MMTRTITVLRPNLTRDQASRALQLRGPIGFAGRWFRGPLRRLADLYLPFGLFRVEIDSAARTCCKYFASDSAFGLLDPYQLPCQPTGSETISIQTRNVLPPALDEAAAAAILKDKLQRTLFSQGFFRLRDLRIRVVASGDTVHIPYWVGFYGCSDRASLCVMDAVRCRMEGGKMRAALTRWLSA